MPKNRVSIRNAVYAMTSEDGVSAEITMYGDIVETQPVDWWTGEPVEGNYITLGGFLNDLNTLEGCRSVTIRMNSYGGDAGVSTTIHNRLRELSRKGTALTCVVDGVAMSGGSLIMCACDTVNVNPSSLIMIHRCWSFLWGSYNADELRALALTQDAYDRAQVSIYQRKTGLGEDELLAMMSETTYMTGTEAIEKGFADEILEDAEPLDIAASADGKRLFVRGRELHMPMGAFAPDSIPTGDGKKATAAGKPAVANMIQPEETGEGGNGMTMEELREQYPELVEEIETGARTSVDTSRAAQEAVQAERSRMAEIDAVAGLFSDELVQEARYGEKACDAKELCYRAAQQAAGQGRAFLANLEADYQASGAGQVPAAPGAEDEDTPEAVEQAAKAAVKNYRKMKEGKQ